MYDEHSTYSSKDFLIKLLKAFPVPIREVQTDNGSEFTTALRVKDPKQKTMFEKALETLDIKYHRIRVATPQHNGKVERSHRNDQRYFYDWETFRNVDELNEKLEKHLEWSNNKPMRTLGYKSPKQLLAEKLVA